MTITSKLQLYEIFCYKFSHVLNSRNEFVHNQPLPPKSNLGGRILHYILE